MTDTRSHEMRRPIPREPMTACPSAAAVASVAFALPAVLVAVLVAVLAAPVPAAAQTARPTAADVDTAGLATGPGARMQTLLEKTIFQVDVARLELRLGPEAAGRVEALLANRPADDRDGASGPLADSLTAIVLGADAALAEIEFLRGVGLERFLDGIRENLRHAVDAGIITRSQYARIAADLPEWYGFLDGRGLRSGDRMMQRVRGDSLRTVYVSAEGDTLLDQVDLGPEPRLAALGGYLAPGSDFRDGLLNSLLDSD